MRYRIVKYDTGYVPQRKVLGLFWVPLKENCFVFHEAGCGYAREKRSYTYNTLLEAKRAVRDYVGFPVKYKGHRITKGKTLGYSDIYVDLLYRDVHYGHTLYNKTGNTLEDIFQYIDSVCEQTEKEKENKKIREVYDLPAGFGKD